MLCFLANPTRIGSLHYHVTSGVGRQI